MAQMEVLRVPETSKQNLIFLRILNKRKHIFFFPRVGMKQIVATGPRLAIHRSWSLSDTVSVFLDDWQESVASGHSSPDLNAPRIRPVSFSSYSIIKVDPRS